MKTLMHLTTTESSEWLRFAHAISATRPKSSAHIELAIIEGAIPLVDFYEISALYRAWLVFGDTTAMKS